MIIGVAVGEALIVGEGIGVGSGVGTLLIVGLGEGFKPLGKGNAQRLHQQPGAQRPAGIVPVCGDQGVAHTP